MKSKTKYEASFDEAELLFRNAGLGSVTACVPLGDGEFNAAYRVDTTEGTYVLKIAPPPQASVLTYEKNMMRSELFWYDQIRNNTDIRVPEIYFSDLTKKLIPADYFIMEYIDGEALWKAELSEEEKAYVQREKAHMLAKIHRISCSGSGYIQRELKDNWYEALKSMTSDLVADCERLGHQTINGRRLLESIDEHQELLMSIPACMVNFDLWDSNIIVVRNAKEDNALTLVWIDPERSFWGDSAADFITMGAGQKIMLSDKKEVIEAYNEAAAEKFSMTRQEDMRYAFALAYLALVEETEKYVRYEEDEPNFIRNTADAATMYRIAFGLL